MGSTIIAGTTVSIRIELEGLVFYQLNHSVSPNAIIMTTAISASNESDIPSPCSITYWRPEYVQKDPVKRPGAFLLSNTTHMCLPNIRDQSNQKMGLDTFLFFPHFHALKICAWSDKIHPSGS